MKRLNHYVAIKFDSSHNLLFNCLFRWTELNWLQFSAKMTLSCAGVIQMAKFSFKRN